jgi:hypothetical protein
MKTIKVFKTQDGQLFESERDAKVHVKKRKADAMKALTALLEAECGLSDRQSFKVANLIDYHKLDLINDLADLDNDLNVTNFTDDDNIDD